MTRSGLGCIVLLAWLAAGPAAARDVAFPAGNSSEFSAREQKIYAAAFEQAEAKRFDQALATALAVGDPALEKVIRWLEYIEPGRNGDFDAVAGFIAENPNWPGRGALRLRAEKAMPDDLPVGRLLAWFEAHRPVTAAGGARFAEALRRAGAEERATEILRRTWIERDFNRSEERAFRQRFGTVLRRGDEIARLERLSWEHRFAPAKRQARRLGRGYPALAEARRRLARGARGVDAAIRKVPPALRGHPGLVFERARWRQRRGRLEAVIELLDPPHAGAPRPRRWWRIRHWAARRALMDGSISVAYRIASQHGMESGPRFAEAEWLAGWISLRFHDDPASAYGHFRRLYRGVSSPVSLGRGAFWAGEAASLMDGREAVGSWGAVARDWYAAAARYGTSFYGQLAKRRLGAAPGGDLPHPEPPSHQARADFADRELVQIVRMLGRVGEARLEARFLRHLARLANTASDYALVADLAHGQERPDLALRAAKAARMTGVILPDHLFPTLPLPRTENPEPALLLAMIRQESGFHTAAVSRAGARGLMQLMPRTARRVARQIKVRYSRAKLIDDPAYNLRIGRAYLEDLLGRYDGSYILALTAYNAGPARVRRWIDRFGDPRNREVDPVDWIESIPFNETRNYLQRILESLVFYRQRMGGASGEPNLDSKLGPVASRIEPMPGVDPFCCF